MSWPIFHRLEMFRNRRTFCSNAWKSSCVQITSTWIIALRKSAQRTQRTWCTFPVMLSGCHLRTQHPLAITLEMPGSDSNDIIHPQRHLTETEVHDRADLIVFEAKTSKLVLDLELQHAWQWKPEFGWHVFRLGIKYVLNVFSLF